MYPLNSKTVLVCEFSSALGLLSAATPGIGIAMSEGNILINSSKAAGNATLFDGSAMDDLRPGREVQMVGLDLRNGIVKATRVTVYEKKLPIRMKLTKGSPLTEALQ